MQSLKMPPFCRNLVTSEMLSFPFLCACKISRALEACAFTLRLYSLCRVFCLNSPGSCAFKWVERLGGNRTLARARHVHGKGGDHSINDWMKWWKLPAGQTGILECWSCTVIERLPLTLFAVNLFIERRHVKPCLKVLKTYQRTVTCELRFLEEFTQICEYLTSCYPNLTIREIKEAALMNLFSLRTCFPWVSNPRGIVLYWLFLKASR